jgi:hypothetical protein
MPGGAGVAGVGQAAQLFHRQGVELGAQHVLPAAAVAEDCHQPGPGDAFGDLESRRAHLARQPGCSGHFMERQFRLLMEVLAEHVERLAGGQQHGVKPYQFFGNDERMGAQQ